MIMRTCKLVLDARLIIVNTSVIDRFTDLAYNLNEKLPL